jgi:long-chain acyl-CoA synthetase
MPETTRQPTVETTISEDATFWRVEGSLLNLSAVRPVAFFIWNAQSFSERWTRRGGLALSALVRPLLYATNRVFATRVLHSLLRRISQDRLDLLGEEYFHYVLKPQLKPDGVQKLKELIAAGHSPILVSQGLDHVMRPLAEFLGVERLIANRLEFRHGLATGRLVNPVIRPRGGLARLLDQKADGRISREQLCKDLGLSNRPQVLDDAVISSKRSFTPKPRPIVLFESRKRIPRLSLKQTLAGKHVLLIGVTGFIGKVWLAKLLSDIPDIGKVYLLIRRQRSTSARRRFEKIVAESPVFEGLFERYGKGLAKFVSERIEVVEGDISQPDLGLDPHTRAHLARTLDVIVNSAGLTEFNPDLRDALTINVDGTIHLIDFLRECDHAALMHLSTCFVVGSRDGRVAEELAANYTPANVPGFDAEEERLALHALVREIEARSHTDEVTEELREQALAKADEAQDQSETGLQVRIRRYRGRWVQNEMVEAGMREAKRFGWPNTYTFTKSLGESLFATRGADLPIAVVRPSIVETSIQEPFQGWNEGVNTSSPISYLLGTFFRQLPSNGRKCLDIIPVDLVCRGMTLIAAALVERCHERVYQLAASGCNPCDMRRSIELTCLAHRKFYRTQNGFEYRLRAAFDAIPVSKERYQRLSAPGQKAVLRALQRISAPLLWMQRPLVRRERSLDRVAKLIELYEPFILYNEQVFEADNVRLLSEALTPEEKELFGYDPTIVDWWEYWINIHIPALRKWSYPLIEGRPLEAPQRREFHLLDPSGGADNGASRVEENAVGTGATCLYS